VSKFHPVEAIREAYDAGERHFGESRVQELKQKIPLLPDDIHWHFIGHLQTNKVRDLLKLRPYLIHSVDSERLLNALNEEAIKQGIVQNILLEIHVAKEETKTGLSKTQVRLILDHSATVWHGLRIVGLMAMATNTDDETEIRRCFEEAAKCLNDAINDQMVNDQMVNNSAVLSMGMSDDYQIAIECGSNMVRIGSTIFGERTYK
jgi:pyridoxal phosphate enzyme (YggS family)